MSGESAKPVSSYALELKGLSKAFGDCVANRNVSLSVQRGTIHALVGENGAGKSTAMKMLFGLYRPDNGQIIVGGKERQWRSPRDAIAAGIGMVHQHFMLAQPLSGLDNVILGDEPAHSQRFLPSFLRPIDRKKAEADLSQIAKDNHFAIDLSQAAGTMPVGLQQRLEILKLLYRKAEILVLDEPTAVLTPKEVDELFANLRKLRDSGKTILIITHKLREVLALCDDVTVIRRGETVKSLRVAETNEQELADLMVGRAVRLQVEVPAQKPLGDSSSLDIKDLTLETGRGRPPLAGLTLNVRPGEIVGIAGVEGNGQSELLDILMDPKRFFGRSRRSGRARGSLDILGTDARTYSARKVRAAGVGIVPEDRHRQGLLLQSSIAANYLLGHQNERALNSFGFIHGKRNRQETEQAIAAFDIRPPEPDTLVQGLSGGNQQKVVIAREFRHNPKLFVFAQPTRGVDVGSIEFIHSRIVDLRTQGYAVLLVSSALEEILALSDRILVMFEGAVAGSFERGGCSEADLGRLMGGGA